MPSKLLWDVLPAFRVPSRWDALLMTAVLPLAALGLQSARRALGVAVVAVAIVLSFVELSTHRVTHFRTVPVPPEYVALKRDTPSGIVAEYPLGYSDLYRLWQRVHGRRLVNGAPDGSFPDEARMMLLDPKEPGTASMLSLLGITAIVIHPGGPADVPLQPQEPNPGEGFRFVGRFPDTSSVWAVTAPPAPAFVVLSGGFAPPRRLDNGTLVYPLIASGGVGVMEIRSREPRTVHVEFTAGAPGAQRDLLVQDTQGDHKYGFTGSRVFSENVELPRGVSQLIFKTAPATSESDAIVLTQPHITAGTGAATFHAIPVSADPGF
jgi:hypothetical protein